MHVSFLASLLSKEGGGRKDLEMFAAYPISYARMFLRNRGDIVMQEAK